MAFSKQHLYPSSDLVNSHIYKALSHPARLTILKKLQQSGSLSVQVIGQDHPISKETLSGHLKILRQAQLVTWEERFPYTFYQVHQKNIEQAMTLTAQFFQLFGGSKSQE